MTAANGDPAVTVCFEVQIEAHRLGRFTSCEGLGLEVVMEQREEGGTNGFVWQLPTRMKYSNIKLSRPLCEDTRVVVEWLNSTCTGFKRTTANIEVLAHDTEPVAKWTLLDVIPVKWTGPNLSLDSPKVALETLELAHHGLVPVKPDKGQEATA